MVIYCTAVQWKEIDGKELERAGGGEGCVWRTRLAGLLTLRSELSRDRRTDKSFMGSTADGDSSWSRQASG